MDNAITIRRVCDYFRVPPPEILTEVCEEPRTIVLGMEKVTEGSIFIHPELGFDFVKALRLAEESGAAVMFADEVNRDGAELDGYSVPVIFLSQINEKTTAMLASIKEDLRRRTGLKTVAITGSVGKTTTKDFLRLAVGEKYEMYYSKGNTNSYRAVACNATTRLDESHQVYIQEVGAGIRNAVWFSGAILKADMFVLTNVYEHHLNVYESYENLFADKLSIQDNMQEDGVIIANFDDEGIAAADFKRRVVSVGMDTEKDVDYRIENPVQDNEVLRFDLTRGEQTYQLKARIIGIHNIYNIACAFACAVELGVPEEAAAQGIRKFRTKGLRQNFKNIGGYKLYVDCYNVCGASTEEGIRTMEAFHLDEGGQKIAVLGGENKLGEDVSERTFALGQKLAGSHIDRVICFGSEMDDLKSLNKYGDGKSLAEGLRQGGFSQVEFITDREELIHRIREVSHPGDMLFFKGIWLLDMAQIIDSAFGSAFSLNYGSYKTKAQIVSENGWSARLVRNMEGVEIFAYEGKPVKKLVIPDHVEGHPVFRIGAGLFSENQTVQSVDFGGTAVNIGPKAFAGCTALKKVTISGNVRMISSNVFRGCESLKKVTLEEGVTHIGPGVFAGCASLKKVVVPRSVGFLSKRAFDRESDCTVERRF